MQYSLLWTEENHNIYDLEPSLLNYSIRSKNKFGIGITSGIIFGRQFHAELFLTQEEINNMGIEGRNFYMNPQNLVLLRKEILAATAGLFRMIKHVVSKDISKLDSSEFFQLYCSFNVHLGDIFTCYSITEPQRFTKLEQELLEFLSTKKLADTTSEVIILTKPSVRFIFPDNDIMKFDTESILRSGSIINSEFVDSDFWYEVPIHNSEKEGMIKKLNPPKEILHIINVLSKLAEERMRMRLVFTKALYYAEYLYNEISKRYNVAKKDLKYYDWMDVAALIQSHKILSPEKIELRKHGVAKILENGKIRLLEGDKALELTESIRKELTVAKDIHGTVASKGKVIGRVILLLNRQAGEKDQKIAGMNKGDILVTEMTHPNIITACERAGAIVTDEGGMLCHAAIVSREFGIPCIIGTNIASWTLKDGDLVEVDAEKGIVRRLHSNKYPGR